MTPAATAALVAVFATFVVGLVWRLVRGEFRYVWLLCLPVAVFAVAALVAPGYRLWALAVCVMAAAALSMQPFLGRRTAVPAGAPGPARDPDAADIPLRQGDAPRTRSQSRWRHGRTFLVALILLNVVIAGTALLRTAGWYRYSDSESFASSERCLRTTGGRGTSTVGPSLAYGQHVLAVRAPGGVQGSAVFLDSSASARTFANDMAASTSLAAIQRGPIVLVTPRPVEGLELRRLGSCLHVVEVEQLSHAFGAPFTRDRYPFGSMPRAHRG
jgi:hypothetical protein